MKEEEYEDYLVEKAKELLDEDTDAGAGEDSGDMEMPRNTGGMDEKVEEGAESKIPVPWDPREVEALARNRKSMTNEELEEFLRKDSELQEDLQEVEWKGFARWEERLIIGRHQELEPDELAEELGRDRKEVELKMRIMGLNPDVNQG